MWKKFPWLGDAIQESSGPPRIPGECILVASDGLSPGGDKRVGGGVLMKTHSRVFLLLTPHQRHTGTQHAGFSPARLSFRRVTLATTPHPCAATPTGSAMGYWAFRVPKCWTFSSRDYTPSTYRTELCSSCTRAKTTSRHIQRAHRFVCATLGVLSAYVLLMEYGQNFVCSFDRALKLPLQ